MTIPAILTRKSAARLSDAVCRWAGAGVVYFSILGASIAAAAALVIDEVPMLMLGF